MFGPDHYVPVLKCKQGERQALSVISDSTKDKLTPLIEIDDLPQDLDSGAPTRDVDHHTRLALEPLVQSWGARPLFLDAGTMAPYQSTNGTTGPRFVFDEADTAGLAFIPVIGLRRSAHEIAAAAHHSSRGLCLRLDDDDMGDIGLQNRIDGFLQQHRIDLDSIDVVIDLGVIWEAPLMRVLALSLGYLRALPHLKAWRTLTLAASAFPENMAVLQSSSSATFERTEWLAWNHLYQQRAALPRLPTFGDYGVQHPIVMEGFDPRYMAMSAAIRYTLDREWLIVKGQSTRQVRATTQYQGLARQLIGRPNYMGSGHCPGCADINSCAQGAAGLGSSSVWRRIGTTHHLTHAAAQIGSLAFP